MSVVDDAKKSRIMFSILLVLLAVMVGVGFKAETKFTWPIILVLFMLMFMTVGYNVNGRLLGVLINERNCMSLSRFQMVLWTIIVLSAFATIVFIRTRSGHGAEALDIKVPSELWTLIGINSAALVGSPLLSSNKRKKVPTEAALAGKVRKEMGILSVKNSPDEASFMDLFKGDEINNWDYVDMPRLQMFFFTIIVAISYCVSIYTVIVGLDPSLHPCVDPSQAVELPPLDTGLLTLMGISNTAYLGGKSVDQTPSKPAPKADPKPTQDNGNTPPTEPGLKPDKSLGDPPT